MPLSIYKQCLLTPALKPPALYTPLEQITSVFIPGSRTYLTLVTEPTASVIQHYLTTKKKMVAAPQALITRPQWPAASHSKPEQRSKVSVPNSEDSAYFESKTDDDSPSDQISIQSKPGSASQNVLKMVENLASGSSQRLSHRTEKIKSNINRNLNMRQGSQYEPHDHIRADSHKRFSFKNQQKINLKNFSISSSKFFKSPERENEEDLGSYRTATKSGSHNIFESNLNPESVSTFREMKKIRSEGK